MNMVFPKTGTNFNESCQKKGFCLFFIFGVKNYCWLYYKEETMCKKHPYTWASLNTESSREYHYSTNVFVFEKYNSS